MYRLFIAPSSYSKGLIEEELLRPFNQPCTFLVAKEYLSTKDFNLKKLFTDWYMYVLVILFIHVTSL